MYTSTTVEKQNISSYDSRLTIIVRISLGLITIIIGDGRITLFCIGVHGDPHCYSLWGRLILVGFPEFAANSVYVILYTCTSVVQIN